MCDPSRKSVPGRVEKTACAVRLRPVWSAFFLAPVYAYSNRGAPHGFALSVLNCQNSAKASQNFTAPRLASCESRTEKPIMTRDFECRGRDSNPHLLTERGF